MQQARRLYKSPDDRLLFGVAGGHAEYFDIDPVIVRVAWVVLTIVTGGVAALVYLVLAIVTPEDRSREAIVADEGESEGDDADYQKAGRRSSRRNRARYAIAALLIVMGVLFLLSNLGVFQSIRWDLIWPAAIIALGLAILIPSIRR
jgi:phage shock protein PspC (stress-responsive transcriptional regulator)